MRNILLILLLFSFHGHGFEKKLQVAVNLGAPWAYFDEEQGITGIDVEIIRQVTHKMGYEAEFHLLAYNRLIKEFNEGKYDIASPAAFNTDRGYTTSTYLPFEDVAISLKEANLQVKMINDLADKSVIAYQSATTVLGPDFALAVKNTDYLELVDRNVQLKLLINHKTDIVIGERRLLSYTKNALFPDTDISVHSIFTSQDYGAITQDETLQQAFDIALDSMRTSGEYARILASWP
ncbi:substrate-binding periplasmic protein [Flavobacterium sp. W21_SRS_FM6]|uniref:substrate-binding periplasmic protein n=1 Tax=Flavobacterium sp. W21_SRS_FM6 TaxID=3240268 RepID=UPI003F90E4F3